MPLAANHRDVAVAVAAAVLGGSVVAGAFAAASFLRQSQSSACYSAPRAWDSADSNFIAAWIRLLFRRVSSKPEQRLITAGGEHTGGTPNPSLCNGSVKADPFNPSKRKGYLSWNDYFMAIAFLSAQRSKDPNRQVGACLVSQDQIILGIGYNGFPRGCSDDELPWAKMSKDGDSLKTKYPYPNPRHQGPSLLLPSPVFSSSRGEGNEDKEKPSSTEENIRLYVCHAEVNAIMNKNHASAAGQRLYVTMFPCNECAKIIIQARIAEVIYFTEKGQAQGKNSQESSFVASRRLLAMAGVKVWQYKPQQQALVLEYR